MAFKIDLKPKADPSKTSLKYLLHRHLVQMEKARPYERVHASDLMKSQGGDEFCAREYCLGQKFHSQRPDERLATAESVTFAYGRAVEDLVRQWFTEIGVAYGDWFCEACNHLHPLSKKPEVCSQCECPLLRFEETTFKDPESGVTCRPDLFVDFGRPKLTVVEVKSIDKEKIKSLLAPMAEHRWRTNGYMRIIEKSGHPYAPRIDTQDAFVLYVTKGGYGFKDEEIRKWKLLDGDFSPFRDFPVSRNDEDTDEQFGHAGLVELFKATGEIPEGICPTAMVKRAKFCNMRHRCWGDD